MCLIQRCFFRCLHKHFIIEFLRVRPPRSLKVLGFFSWLFFVCGDILPVNPVWFDCLIALPQGTSLPAEANGGRIEGVHGSVEPVRFCLDCVLWETLEETRKLQKYCNKGHIFANTSRSHQLLNPSFFEANGLESGSKADMLRMIEKSAFGSQLVGRDFLQEFAWIAGAIGKMKQDLKFERLAQLTTNLWSANEWLVSGCGADCADTHDFSVCFLRLSAVDYGRGIAGYLTATKYVMIICNCHHDPWRMIPCLICRLCHNFLLFDA